MRCAVASLLAALTRAAPAINEVATLGDGNLSWTSYAANSTPSATGKPPSCADGSRAPLAYLWNILYNDHYTDAGQTTALDGLPAVSSLLGNTGYEASGWPGPEGFGRPPSAIGPWCDKQQHPGCKPAFIFADGGVPQNKSYANNGPLMQAHLDSLQTAADLTLPPDWDGVIGFDWEGWQPVYDHFLFTGYQNKSMDIVRAEHPDWTNESKIAEQAAIEFNVAAQAFFNATILKMRQIRPKARLGFYGTPTKAYGTWWNATAIPCNASVEPATCRRSASSCQWCTGPLIKNDTSQGFCTSQHNPCPLEAANAMSRATSSSTVSCNSGNINERYCYLPSETKGHIIKTVGPPFNSYLSGCCKLCNTTAGCRAWSYESVKVPTPGFKCVLLDKEGHTMHANETYKCVIGECIKDAPSPSPPGPAPQPSPHPAPSPSHLTPDQKALIGIQEHNDALQWLWNQVDVLMPELYISEGQDASYIRGYLKEAERLVQNAHAAGNTKLSIVPFTWQRYSHTDTKFLDVEHLRAEFEVPFEFPHVEAVLVRTIAIIHARIVPNKQRRHSAYYCDYVAGLGRSRDWACDCSADKRSVQ